MRAVAIITARGGSKRIPRKNIKDFCGKPIIAYSIEAALNSGLFDEVMVSTEDPEIAQIAKDYGAAVPFFRSAENANDYAGTADVLREVLADYAKQGKTFDCFACLYPTAPFVTPEKLQKGMSLLEQTSADIIWPVVAYSFPPQRAFMLDDGGYLAWQYPQYRLTRSQDLPTIYHDCGQFYCYNTDAFLNKPGEQLIKYPLIISETEVQDIDNLEDWQIAEMKYRLMVSK